MENGHVVFLLCAADTLTVTVSRRQHVIVPLQFMGLINKVCSVCVSEGSELQMDRAGKSVETIFVFDNVKFLIYC